MPSLTVWRYDTGAAAVAAEVRLKVMEEKQLLTVHDAVTVTWAPGNERPNVRHLRHETAAAATKGSILGFVVGSLVLTPVGGLAAGAGIGVLRQRVADTGIDEHVLTAVREVVTPGTSALVVLSSDEDVDAIEPLLRDEAALVHVDLAADATASLHDLVAHRTGADEDT